MVGKNVFNKTCITLTRKPLEEMKKKSPGKLGSAQPPTSCLFAHHLVGKIANPSVICPSFVVLLEHKTVVTIDKVASFAVAKLGNFPHLTCYHW